VPGNHERSQLPTSLFLNHPLINVFTQPKIFLHRINNTKILIGGFPFIRGNISQGLIDILRQTGWYQHQGDIKILALHQAIEGATVGPGTFTFRRGKDVISLSSLPGDAKTILCGHIHRKQILEKRVQNTSMALPVIFSGSTERTSFAEKDEKKGFYHIKFTVDSDGKWFLSELRFFELPSRPMEDLYIDPDYSEQKFIELIQNKIKVIHPDSIIRFNSNKPVNRQLRNVMTTKYLSQLLPANLNFTLSSKLFDPDARLR
jgi:DNA repair exonuclease SbcCD nuclease subunit